MKWFRSEAPRKFFAVFFGGLAVVLAFSTAPAPVVARGQSETMVLYVQTVWAVVPGGSSPNPNTTVITTSAQRERSDDQYGTFVIECDLQRTIYWKASDKTYTVESFQDLSKQYAAIEAQIKGNGETESGPSIGDVLDAKTTIIDGLTADHLVETLTYPQGEGSLGPKVERDVWYAPGADPFRCPAYDGLAGKPPRDSYSKGSSSGTISMSTGVLGRPNVKPGDLVLRESDDLGMGITMRTEVTSIKIGPYDTSYFEPPAGFVQVSPRPLVMPTSR